MKKMLVVGANGFLGSHVTRLLVQQGHAVRVMVRKNANTQGIDDLQVERKLGDIFDDQSLREAMQGCDVVFYCVVDTRAWLRDTTPLFRTNVEGLQHVLDAAVAVKVPRFIFTSTIGTIARNPHGVVSEVEPHNWVAQGGAYIQSRVQAEQMVLRYHREQGLPVIAMCVANTFGPGDYGATPHGAGVAAAALGQMPFTVKNMAWEAVGIEDAARALVLAGERGRIGERYIISESFISHKDMYEAAADAAGAPRPPRQIACWQLMLLAYISDIISRLKGEDAVLRPISVRLMKIMTRMDHSKAERELDWHPRPVLESVRAAARFYVDRARQSSQAS
jgi:dihydroflavonol-4-reductase